MNEKMGLTFADSPWIGAVPNHWRQEKCKFVMRERSEVSEDGSETLLSISEYYGVRPRIERHGDDEHLTRAATLVGYKVVEERDLAMNIMLAWKGAQGVADQRGIVSPAYAVFELDCNRLVPDYAHHLFRCDVYVAEFRRRSTGIIDSRLRLYPQTFLAMPIILPPLEEQVAIASYLAAELARIDSLVAEKKALLNALEDLKNSRLTQILTGAENPSVDSGDEWLPKIPKGWKLVRLKFLGQVRSGVAKGKKYDGAPMIAIPYLRVANVQDGYLDLSDVSLLEVSIDEAERYALKPNDVLMNEGGDYDKVGRGAMWSGEVSPCIHQNHVFAVRLEDVTIAPWLAAILRTAYAKFYFMNNAKQSTNLASISQGNVKEFPVVLPPEAERGPLLQRLNEELLRFTELAEHAREEMALLAELRSTTITDAVLGRIDVRRTVQNKKELEAA